MTNQEDIKATMTENVELYLSPVHAKQLVNDIMLDLHLADVVIVADWRFIDTDLAIEPLIKDEE